MIQFGERMAILHQEAAVKNGKRFVEAEHRIIAKRSQRTPLRATQQRQRAVFDQTESVLIA